MATSAASYFLNGLEEENGKWELIELIGEGTYGEVYRATNVRKEQVAIKICENKPNKHDEIQVESSIFQQFSKHENMVDYYGTYIHRNQKGVPTQIWLIMEYCEGRSVAELAKITVQNGHRLHENVIKYILYETLSGITFLHRNHIIHRDIKGPNILMTANGHVKLIDFGVSSQVAATMDRKHSSVGSPFWMAPEVIACEQQLDYNYDNRCDIWSLGITAIELADGDPPLSDEHPMRALFKIPRNPPPTVKQPKKWSQEYLNFIASAVTKDFEKRPTADIIIKHKFLEAVPTQERLLGKELMSIIHIVIKQYGNSMADNDVGAQTLLARQENAKRNMMMLEVDDLATLSKLTNETILSYVMERYMADQIYTYIGEMLLAVNPFKELKIYGEGASLLYQDTQKENLPPHIFMIACTTYQAMIHKQNDQCCVISGESGSGKTVSANFLVHQFASIGESHGSRIINRNLVDKILQVNPLMEAFGNAQTVINQNSSRFGKFLHLHFTTAGSLVGAQLSEYLLEKSRVVSQPRGERNFHMLYYLIAGLDFHRKLDEFQLNTTNRHRYLNTDELSLAECACTSEMQVRFTQVQQCFEVLGFSGEEIQSLYCLLASVIHLGDIEFVVDDFSLHQGEKAKVINTDTLSIVASLLCVNKIELSEGLTTNSSVTRGEIITRNNNVEQAMDCRDATAKALYGRLFSWIVKKINTLLRAEDKTETLHTKIGILDIFGFENFAINSFEQLCINIANEQLQFYFNEHVFEWEFEEYAAEEIKGVNIQFKNNKPILDLFLQKPVGILALLDEESRFPKASDLTLVEKFQDNIQSEYMTTSKETSTFFTIKHYADKVTYDATGFLEKNRDTLSTDIIQVLQLSTDKTIAALFQTSPDLNGRSTRNSDKSFLNRGKNYTVESKYSSVATNRFQQTVSTHFRQSLRTLLSKVIKSDPHFVRCIRPNIQNSPNFCDEDKVMSQLKYTGALATTNIRRQGYSERILFKDFVNRFKFLLYKMISKVPATPEACVQLLKYAKIDEDETWKIGKTKVFLKYWHAERLSKCFERYRVKVLLCQKCIRCWLMKRKLKHHARLRYLAASRIRAQWLAYKARIRYLQMLEDEKELRTQNSIVTDSVSTGSQFSSSKRSKSASKEGSNKKKYLSNWDKLQRFVYQHNLIPNLNKSTEAKDKQNTDAKHRQSIVSDVKRKQSYVRERSIILSERADFVIDPNDPKSPLLRPYYRNMKRELRGHDDYEDFYNSDDPESTQLKRKFGSSSNNITDDAYERVKDPEGQAALEETRAIILLSQIDLASKEAFEMLNRTSYPVIHSVRAKAGKAGGPKMKNQKLNHKERTIAVVDGYGDPLQQKYRLAKLHLADTIKEDENNKPNFQNAPMLGLVEKPAREESINVDEVTIRAPTKPIQRRAALQTKTVKTPVQKAATPATSSSSHLKEAIVNNQQFYPSRASERATPKYDNDWFYPSKGNHKVLQKTQLIENRIRDVEEREREKKTSEARQINPRNYRYQANGHYDKEFFPNTYEYKPYNYLLNNRTEASKVYGHDNINRSPINQRRFVSNTPLFSNKDYNHKIKSPVVPRTFAQVTNSPIKERKVYKNAAAPNVQNIQKPFAQSAYNKRNNVNDHSNNDNKLYGDWTNVRDIAPRPLPGLATEFQHTLSYMVPVNDDLDFRTDFPKTKRPNGFNYGLKQESVLQDLKLKKTGRLQQLLVK